MSRGRRVVVWLLRTLVAAVLGTTAYLVIDRYVTRRAGERRLAEVVAELDATDPGWRLDDILAEREKRFPPDDQNIMIVVQAAAAQPHKALTEWAARNPDWLPKPGFNRLPAADVRAEVGRVREECRAAIDTARRVRGLPAGGYRLDVKPNPLDTLIRPTQEVHTAAVLLQFDAATAAACGDADRAVTSAHACLDAARGIGDEPTLISMLVRMACGNIAKETAERTLALGVPTTGLTELQATFADEADAPLLAIGLRGERAMLDRLYDSLDTGRTDLGAIGDDRRTEFNPERVFGEWMYRGKLPADRATYLRWTTDMLAVAQRPPHERLSLLTAVPQPDFRQAPLCKLLVPSVGRLESVDPRVKAALRSAAVGIACERYRQKHGRWPAALADIPKDILAAVPLDPYDGRPLRYSKTHDGVVVYSVGPDLADDNGNLSYGQPQPGEDVGFRLWDVGRRRAE
jgi:hypothetical protein